MLSTGTPEDAAAIWHVSCAHAASAPSSRSPAHAAVPGGSAADASARSCTRRTRVRPANAFTFEGMTASDSQRQNEIRIARTARPMERDPRMDWLPVVQTIAGSLVVLVVLQDVFRV